MSDTAPRVQTRKPLTLPRSFSRVLGRLLALPAGESLPLARAAYEAATDPAQRILAMRLRLRLLQEAMRDDKPPVPAIAAPAPEPAPAPVPEPEPEPEPAPEPVKPAKPPKEPKLVSIDPAGSALSAMFGELGSNEGDDDFFGSD